MDEEKVLRKKVGKEMPFKVPEGYFAHLTDEIMDRLPEKFVEERPEVTLWDRIKPMLYMAAMFIGLIFGANLFINKIPNSKRSVETVSTEESAEFVNSFIEPINHQLMMDDYALYQYLTTSESINTHNE